MTQTDETPDVPKAGADAVAAEANDPAKSSKRPLMDVKVYAPFQVYFEGKAYSVRATNAVGPFSVLPQHHNFLCMLVPCTVVVNSPEGKKSLKVHRALLHIKSDKVVIFVDV